ncbi:MAG: hypothetical protein ABI091_25060 [Ferruginibacter sp.]
MQTEIIKKLNLTRANFSLKEPHQYLTLYYYKEDVFMAESNLSDGVATSNIIYRTGANNYCFLPTDYLLSMPNTEIEVGLKRMIK